MVRVDAIGSNVDRFACPNCGSTDRERHLHLCFDRLELWSSIHNAKVLHMAPEQRFPEAIAAHGPSLHVPTPLFKTAGSFPLHHRAHALN